ncbi:MAG TPA: hydrogenase maturation protease [Planctomycetota bacterium]|nr:hydrogenase maturation protease [Planctomycetota bacterium]
MSAPRVLVAGIGNIFLGDDGFGVAVVQRMVQRGVLKSVCIRDFGIRGLDLVYALMDGYDILILVDAMQQGRAPGTVFVMEPDVDHTSMDGYAAPEPHSMTPIKVFSLLNSMGGAPPKITRLVGCEPESFGLEQEGRMGLSVPVAGAVDAAANIVETLTIELVASFNANA